MGPPWWGWDLTPRLGAISFDVTHSRLEDPLYPVTAGGELSRHLLASVKATDTNLTLASYRYSNQEYYSLNEAIQRLDLNGPATQYEYGHSKQRLDEYQSAAGRRAR